MKKIILLAVVFAFAKSYGQDWPLKKIVEGKKAQVAFRQLEPFQFNGDKPLEQRGIYQELYVPKNLNRELMEQRPEAVRLSIPLSSSEIIVCDLVRFELGNIKFTENNNEVIENVKIPLTYRGIVSGEKGRNNVMFTVNEDYVAFTATFGDKVIQLSKADEKQASVYRLYDSRKVQIPEIPFNCGTTETSSSKIVNDQQAPGNAYKPTAPQDKCINVFVECFDSLFQWQGNSSQQTINYVYELFNAVATGYLNEQINIQIIAVNIWTTPDPYRGDTRENALNDLGAAYKDSFWGNIGVGLDYSISSPSRSGLASDIGRVKGVSPNTCNAYTPADFAFCYNDLDYTGVATVEGFPTGPITTGAAIYLVMHEIGHLLGSRHTKWCGWKLTSNPDTYGALDSCGDRESIDTTKPLCAQGPPAPPSGATIMSYCVTSKTSFVNFNNGFGVLPGNAIRDFVDKTHCIPKCVTCTALLDQRKRQRPAFNPAELLARNHSPGMPPLGGHLFHHAGGTN